MAGRDLLIARSSQAALSLLPSLIDLGRCRLSLSSPIAVIETMEAHDDEIFVYMGGDQVVPDAVRRVRIHGDVKIFPEGAFRSRQRLVSVEFHDDIEIIEKFAFN